MLNDVQMSIIIQAMVIRKNNGEDVDAHLEKYTNLTEEEKAEIKEVLSLY